MSFEQGQFEFDIERLNAFMAREGLAALTQTGTIADTVADQLTLVADRLVLIDALHDDDPRGEIARKVGLWQDSGLRLYLMLTCMNMLGSLCTPAGRHLDFEQWLESDDAPEWSRNHPPSESESDVKRAKALFIAYREVHGIRREFERFFDVLPVGEFDSAIASWWVCDANPIVPTILQAIETGYESDHPDLARVAEARRRWDLLAAQAKRRKVIGFLYRIRNRYTHGLRVTVSPMDKDPVFPVYREAARRIREGRIDILCDESFNRIPSDGGFGFNKLECRLNEDRLALRAASIGASDLTRELIAMRECGERTVNRSESVYLANEGLALSVLNRPLTHWAWRWCLVGLSRWFTTATGAR